MSLLIIINFDFGRKGDSAYIWTFLAQQGALRTTCGGGRNLAKGKEEEEQEKTCLIWTPAKFAMNGHVAADLVGDAIWRAEFNATFIIMTERNLWCKNYIKFMIPKGTIRLVLFSI